MRSSEDRLPEHEASGKIIKPSTRSFWRRSRERTDFSLFDFIHGYIYMRWPYQYIGTGVGERNQRLVRLITSIAQFVGRIFPKKNNGTSSVSFADTYHGKAIPLETATRLVSIKESIDLGDLEQVIPYKLARELILQHPDHIAVLDCPCRVSRKDPCLPLDVCLIVGEPFASLVIEHHPHRSRWITSDEAVEILKAEDERGHVHHAFFKDAMLGRFYAICNCCECCCGAMQAQRNGTPMLASSGYVAVVDQDICISCGTCEQKCQFNAISISQEGAIVDLERCMGCGVCVGNCPQAAIELKPEPTKGQPLDLLTLMGERSIN